MKISTSGDFAATAEQVFAVIADPAFQQAKVAELGGEAGSSAAVTTDGDGAVVETTRVLSSDGLPGFVRSVVGDTLRISETQTWGAAGADGSRTGSLRVAVDGVPVTMTGTLALVPTDGGATQHVAGDLTAKVPFLGGKIEDAAAPVIRDAIDAEFALIRTHL